MKVVVISGSPRKGANTEIMMRLVYEYAKTKNEETKFINLSESKIDCYYGPNEKYSDITLQAAKDITEADIWLV